MTHSPAKSANPSWSPHPPDVSDMSAVYREWIGDARETARLKRVTGHVHAWLYQSNAKRRKQVAKKSAPKRGPPQEA